MTRFALPSLLVGALAACGASNENPCPQGQSYDGVSCVGQNTCPPGQVFNGQYCAASSGGQCPAGQTWNGTTCVAGTGGYCPAGQTWNGTACVPQTGGQCPAGQSWNGTACVPQATGGGQCSPATTVDSAVAATMLGPAMAQYVPPGARPEGGAIYSNFQQGQCVQRPIQLQAGKCYTVVGAGQPGVQELDIQFVPATPIPAIPGLPAIGGLGGMGVVAQDHMNGPVAVLGPKPNCYKWPLPIPMPLNLVVRVKSGQGAAAAQVYVK